MERAEVAKLWEASAEIWTNGVRAGYDVYRDALKVLRTENGVPRAVDWRDISISDL